MSLAPHPRSRQQASPGTAPHRRRPAPGCSRPLQASVTLLFRVQHFSSCNRGTGGTGRGRAGFSVQILQGAGRLCARPTPEDRPPLRVPAVCPPHPRGQATTAGTSCVPTPPQRTGHHCGDQLRARPTPEKRPQHIIPRRLYAHSAGLLAWEGSWDLRPGQTQRRGSCRHPSESGALRTRCLLPTGPLSITGFDSGPGAAP